MGDKGYFFETTVLANVPANARVMQEEPFGPLAIINPVASLDEGIEMANSVPFGLTAYGFTNRADYVDRMIESYRNELLPGTVCDQNGSLGDLHAV